MRVPKVIFLDFDGPMRNAECYHRETNGFRPMIPAAIQALNRIIEKTGALVVVSATDRIEGVMACKEMLYANGFTGKVLDVTSRIPDPDNKASLCRGLEIRTWLEEEGSDRYEVESFVIIDDEANMHNERARLLDGKAYRLEDRLIRVQYGVGLTEADADRAIGMLGEL